MKALLYRLNRGLLKLIARPAYTGQDNVPPAPSIVIYVLQHRAPTDLAMLDLACESAGLVSPFEPITELSPVENSRFFCLYRAKAGRITMASQSERLLRLVQTPSERADNIVLIPVSVFWGRAMGGESLWNTVTSEHWAATGKVKRLINLLINRKNIFVHTGRPIELKDIVSSKGSTEILARRTARLLRVRMRQQKETALGPDFSHRRTLVDQVVTAKGVRIAIEEAVAQGTNRDKSLKSATKIARTIASDMSSPTIRIFARFLSWFWNRIYDGIDISGLTDLEEVSSTHCLVYVPSHRSHLDYLLLSYLLYYRGFMIPHIAAGDNLNLPLLGGILRRSGAFFMRRSFKDDPLYAAVFSEYLYQVYRRGHCVEFFPEGGRTRTGRLLKARVGLLKMSVEHQQRGLPKPLAFVPVYFGYEKVVEASSYLSELRGADKQKESISDLVRNVKLIRQNFGRVSVNFGQAIKLDEWLEHSFADPESAVTALSEEIMRRINVEANLNPVNLVALVTLATPKIAIEQHRLKEQIAVYQHLLSHISPEAATNVSTDSPIEIIEQVEALGMLQRETTPFGPVFSHDPFNAALMTWYRNNVLHTLAIPALVACLMINRRRGIPVAQLREMIELIYPYLAQELAADPAVGQLPRVLSVMFELGLLIETGDEVSPPGPEQAAHLQLTLLSQLVSQTLERMFIVIYKVTEADVTRDELLASSQVVAQRIARLNGINAPEFFDRTLFDQFIDALLKNQLLIENSDRVLRHDPLITRILRAAEFVIDPRIRHSVASDGLSNTV